VPSAQSKKSIAGAPTAARASGSSSFGTIIFGWVPGASTNIVIRSVIAVG
jgi:hypothetical protein